METINFDTWFEKYKPIKNTITENSSYNETMFETFGDDLDFIKSQHQNRVWTLLDCDNEESWIIPGYSWVNRIGYFITEIPWESEDIQVNDNEMCTVEEAIDYCVNFAKEHLKINLDNQVYTGSFTKTGNKYVFTWPYNDNVVKITPLVIQ